MAENMPSSASVRGVPYSLEAEQSVLGAILIDPERIRDIANLVKSDDFYVESHRLIFGAMQELFLQSRNIDVVTLADTLTKSGNFSEAGSKDYLMVLADTVPSV